MVPYNVLNCHQLQLAGVNLGIKIHLGLLQTMRLNSRKVWLQSVYATGLVTQDSRSSPGWCPRSFAQHPKRTGRAVDGQAINSGAWQGFGMSGAGVRNTARLSRASEYKLIDAQQVCELLRKVRC